MGDSTSQGTPAGHASSAERRPGRLPRPPHRTAEEILDLQVERYRLDEEASRVRTGGLPLPRLSPDPPVPVLGEFDRGCGAGSGAWAWG